jgi:hypothetical protein
MWQKTKVEVEAIIHDSGLKVDTFYADKNNNNRRTVTYILL